MIASGVGVRVKPTLGSKTGVKSRGPLRVSQGILLRIQYALFQGKDVRVFEPFLVLGASRLPNE